MDYRDRIFLHICNSIVGVYLSYFLDQEKKGNAINKIFSALAEKFKSVWIVLARCYLDEKLCTKNGHIQVQEWFPDFYVPKMTYPLRGTSPIVKFVKKNNEEMLKVLKFLYNLSIFLLD